MTTRTQVLSFLRSSAAFCASGDPSFGATFARQRQTHLPNAVRANGDKDLRLAQQQAWDGIARTRASLVLGPPGTGKTHLLSYLMLGHVWARGDMGLGSRVFLTAFTRSAIENLLSALAKRTAGGPIAPRLLYLGSWTGGAMPLGVELVDLKASGGRELLAQALQAGPVVVGGTIWKLSDALGRGALGQPRGETAPVFDLIAIDEASQLPLSHGLLALAGLAEDGRIVVAGDDRQLPPVNAVSGITVDGKEFGGSLYAFMKREGIPEFPLEETFRLSEPLVDFPRSRFYGPSYQSAVPQARLQLIPDWDSGLQHWEKIALDPDNSKVVIVHDGPSASVESPFETEMAARLVALLKDRMVDSHGAPASEVWAEGLAVISPHRAQGRAIRRRLASSLGSEEPFIETVDRIQGKERDAVILSYAVSDPEFAEMEAEFIFSPQRLNVAVTRARSKLIVLISRRLLDVVPAQHETLEKAEVLREFAFSAASALKARVTLGALPPVAVDVRVEGFVPIEDMDGGDATDEKVVELDKSLEAILVAVRRAVTEGTGQFPHATLAQILKVAPVSGGQRTLFLGLRSLHGLGWVQLAQRHSDYGTFWTAQPFDHPRAVWPVDDPDRLARILSLVRGSPLDYGRLRDRFVWMDDAERDVLRPLVEAHVRARELRFIEGAKGELVAEPEQEAVALPALPALSDDDFRVLNALEDLDAKRAAAGLFELWSHQRELELSTGSGSSIVSDSIARLHAHGHLMRGQDGELRSRIGELAREVRYLKQRFVKDDASSRPYLVRGIKMLVRDRRKPMRKSYLDELFDRVSDGDRPEVKQALDGLLTALRPMWGERPTVAGFQKRGFEAIFNSWIGRDLKDAFVVSADTGSGKTEAMALPMIAGACVDALVGIRGMRAVLTYPRVRLAANQSQRLAKYIAALANVEGMPTLSLGVQFGEIPKNWRSVGKSEDNKSWVISGDRCSFPLFNCPIDGCGGALSVAMGGGLEGRDRLDCNACGWTFRGWAGTKDGMKASPPTFFLPTVDSLHVWLQDPAAGRMFGDRDLPPPRALMADEIHLYSHIHGAQVGHTLRRLLFRSEVNHADGQRPLAIGMSATLGDPVRTFSRLVGRDVVVPIAADLAEADTNPRGREAFLFIQPEIESRSKDVAGAATAIQSIMCLSHGMRRRTGSEGGYRTLAFLDSIDKVRRLHSDFQDAERNQNLARLRTVMFPDDPITGRIVDECCGDPSRCKRSTDGECWWFAANDARQVFADGRPWQRGKPLAVAPNPVSSKVKDRVEQMIKESDVVFATSSLEVGYDDPDIAFVFQHYAPQNLASFIQRKGRGGRGADDRPLTAITLSMYSPRDSYWYARPELMLDTGRFDAPVNPDNHFVRRAQILSLSLDAFASWQAKAGRSFVGADGRIVDGAMDMAQGWVADLFGRDAWVRYGFSTLRDLWEAAARKADGLVLSAREAREQMPWVPKFLHETINLPAIEISPLPGEVRSRDKVEKEDVALVLALAAPGNISRRFDGRVGTWIPPRDGRAPWLSAHDLALAERVPMFGGDLDRLIANLPVDARSLASGGDLRDCLSGEMVRPTVMTFERAGKFAPLGNWTPDQAFVAGVAYPRSERPAKQAAVGHRSEGRLCGTTIITADEDQAEVAIVPDLEPYVDRVSFFVGRGDGASTGLQFSRVYWGAEGRIVFDEPKVDDAPFSQTFVDEASGLISLHGYASESEGVRFGVNRTRLSAFVDQVVTGSSDSDSLRRMAARCHQLSASNLVMAGLDRYSATTIGKLAGLAMTTPQVSGQLRGSLGRFSVERHFKPLIKDLVDGRHQCDPMLTTRRVEAALTAISTPAYSTVLRDALRACLEPEADRAHVRSSVLHSLALRLRDMFVLVSQGDERSVAVHVKVPVRYGVDAEDIITISEVGEHGDGTTRAFRERLPEFSRLWREGFATACPNAAEDRFMDRLLDARSEHGRWLQASPRDTAALAAIAAEIGVDGTGSVPAPLTRALFGTLEVGGRSARLFDVLRDAREARNALEAELGRPVMGWELSSRLVASETARVGVLDDLFKWYGEIPETFEGEGSLSPTARFAEQVEAAAGHLCLDGCNACVRQRSDIMPDALLDVSVSRTLLEGFLAET